MIFQLLILFGSIILLSFAAHWLVQGISSLAHFLRWREFVVAFFVMAIGGSIPNLVVGISSALHGIPELSLGDVVGNSVIDLTLVVALAVLVGGNLTAQGKLIQQTALLTIFAAVAPLILLLDQTLSRMDGIILILLFFAYSAWMITHRTEHVQTYTHENGKYTALKTFGLTILGLIFLILAAEGLVGSVSFFAETFGLPIAVVGILGISLVNSLPELYFAVTAAKRGKSRIVLGELMGSVIILTSLVLGVVAFLAPITIDNFSPFALARFFLVIVAFFFLLFMRTGRSISKKEAIFLVSLYLAFVVGEIFFQGPVEQCLEMLGKGCENLL